MSKIMFPIKKFIFIYLVTNLGLSFELQAAKKLIRSEQDMSEEKNIVFPKAIDLIHQDSDLKFRLENLRAIKNIEYAVTRIKDFLDKTQKRIDDIRSTQTNLSNIEQNHSMVEMLELDRPVESTFFYRFLDLFELLFEDETLPISTHKFAEEQKALKTRLDDIQQKNGNLDHDVLASVEAYIITCRTIVSHIDPKRTEKMRTNVLRKIFDQMAANISIQALLKEKGLPTTDLLWKRLYDRLASTFTTSFQEVVNVPNKPFFREISTMFPQQRMRVLNLQSYLKGLQLEEKDQQHFLSLVDNDVTYENELELCRKQQHLIIDPELTSYMNAWLDSSKSNIYRRKLVIAMMARLQVSIDEVDMICSPHFWFKLATDPFNYDVASMHRLFILNSKVSSAFLPQLQAIRFLPQTSYECAYFQQDEDLAIMDRPLIFKKRDNGDAKFAAGSIRFEDMDHEWGHAILDALNPTYVQTSEDYIPLEISAKLVKIKLKVPIVLKDYSTLESNVSIVLNGLVWGTMIELEQITGISVRTSDGFFVTEKTSNETNQSFCLNLLTADWFIQDKIRYGHVIEEAFDEEVRITREVCQVPKTFQLDIYPGELVKKLVGLYRREKSFQNVFKLYNSGQLKFVIFNKDTEVPEAPWFVFSEFEKKSIHNITELKELYNDSSIETIRPATAEETVD